MIKLGAKGYMGTIFPHVAGLPPAGAVAMSICMAPIEIIGKLVKPFALAVRLFGNMTAGHFVILSLFGIIFLFGTISGWNWAVGIMTAALVIGDHDAGADRGVPAGVCLCAAERRVHRADAARAPLGREDVRT